MCGDFFCRQKKWGKTPRSLDDIWHITKVYYNALKSYLICVITFRVPSCTGFFGPYTMFWRVHNMYPRTIIYFVSCTLDLCSPYVALFHFFSLQKIQFFPQKIHFFLAFLANLAFLAFIDFFGFLGQFCIFWLFWPFLENFGFHVAYLGGTYRVQKKPCSLTTI
jgi:hypothetical protein